MAELSDARGRGLAKSTRARPAGSHPVRRHGLVGPLKARLKETRTRSQSRAARGPLVLLLE
eukprot:2699808-Alexandrium_andersonii.AAC.1